MRQDMLKKLIVVSLLGLVGLWLISSLLMGTGLGLGYHTRGVYGGGHMYMGGGFGYGTSFAYWLYLLVKVLFAVFVISMIVGIGVWAKNLFTAEDIEAVKCTLRGTGIKGKCSACGYELNVDWKICPHCGKEIVIKTA